MHSREGRKPDWGVDLSKISSLFDRLITIIKPPIVRPPTPPVPMYHGMFRCMSKISSFKCFARPIGQRHVAF